MKYLSKIIRSSIFIVFLSLWMATVFVFANQSHQSGDINADGVVNILDVVLISKHLESLVDFDREQLLAADYNNDGNVSYEDLVLLIKHILSLPAKTADAKFDSPAQHVYNEADNGDSPSYYVYSD